MAALPQASELFADVKDNPIELATRFDGFKHALKTAIADGEAGRTVIEPGDDGVMKLVRKGSINDRFEQLLQDAAKGASPDTLSSLTTQIGQMKGVMADITKDITTTSPLSTGLVQFDLQGPSKYLVPVKTPLRDKLPRTQGMGLSARYKRILGITGSGTGGVAHPPRHQRDHTDRVRWRQLPPWRENLVRV